MNKDFYEWQVRVEKKLTQIDERILAIIDKLPDCEKENHNQRFKTDRWLIGILFTMIVALMTLIVTK